MRNREELQKQLLTAQQIAWEKYLKENMPDHSIYPSEITEVLKYVYNDAYYAGSIFAASIFTKFMLDPQFDDPITPGKKINVNSCFPYIPMDSLKNN